MRKIISKSDILSVFSELGVEPGDRVLSHSFVGIFGSLENGVQTFADAMKEAVGEKGNLIFPTFNYDFFKGVVYDPETSPSQVGQLTEYFRSQENTVRSFHPVYSLSVWGNHKEEYCKNLGLSAFGSDSFFGQLRDKNIKYMFIGIDMQYATYIHHVEETIGVPYRFMKEFNGQVKRNGNIEPITVPIFSRFRNFGPITLLRQLQNRLFDKGLAQRAKLGRGEIITTTCKSFYDEALAFYEENPYAFLDRPFTAAELEGATR